MRLFAWSDGELLIWMDTDRDYDLTDVSVATPESVEGLSRIIALVQAGILPKSVSYSAVDDMIATAGRASAEAALQEAEANKGRP